MRKRIRSRYKAWLALGMCLFFSVQVMSCGILLYPERRGQKTGQIDLAVALMDGIGLLFFVVPGLVAFVVDFHTGTIYFPPGSDGKNRRADHESTDRNEPLKMVKVHPDQLDANTIEQIVKEHTGKTLRLDSDDLLIIAHREPMNINRTLMRLSREHGIPPVNTGRLFKGFARNSNQLSGM